MDSLNGRASKRGLAHKRQSSPLFLICPNGALNCMAIHLSFSNMICWHTFTKSAPLYYSTAVAFFYRPCPMTMVIAVKPFQLSLHFLEKKREENSTTLFETDCVCMCVCSRTFEHIRKDETNSCQQRFASFAAKMSAIN